MKSPVYLYQNIKYDGKKYRVADKCNKKYVVDIYQEGDDHSKCKNAPHPPLAKQTGLAIVVL